MQATFQKPQGNDADFAVVSPLINLDDRRREVEISGLIERKVALTDVALVLRRIECNVHPRTPLALIGPQVPLLQLPPPRGADRVLAFLEGGEVGVDPGGVTVFLEC